MLRDSLLLALAAKRKAIVDGAVEEGASSSRRDWRGERVADIVEATILVQFQWLYPGRRDKQKQIQGSFTAFRMTTKTSKSR